MKIELRNVKYYASMSEETGCFEARFYVDGTDCGRVSNRGTGGCHEYSDWKAQARVNAYAKTLPKKTTDLMDPHDKTKRFTYPQSADSLVDDALTAHLRATDLRKAIRSRVLFVRDGKIFQTSKYKTAAELEGTLKNPDIYKAFGDQILNLMPPDKAFEVFVQYGG